MFRSVVANKLSVSVSDVLQFGEVEFKTKAVGQTYVLNSDSPKLRS